MKLIAHVIDGHQVDIRPAPVERDRMEATNQRFAYRCLPLNMANASMVGRSCATRVFSRCGPEGTNRCDRVGAGTRDDPASGQPFRARDFYLRTEPGAELMVQGPINRPKDGIAALSGIIETDWSPYSFTMNWIITRPDTPVRFEKGEPYCHIFPVSCGALRGSSPNLKCAPPIRSSSPSTMRGPRAELASTSI
jgi:Family of unknown function (DUF6065)